MEIIGQIQQLLLFFLILAGPLPLCFSLVHIIPTQPRHCRAQGAFLILVSWFVVQESLVLGLGAANLLNLLVAALAEAALLGIGLWLLFHYRGKHGARLPSAPLHPRIPFTRLEGLMPALLLFTGLCLLIHLVTRVTLDYDSIAYHLLAAAKWYQAAGYVNLNLEEFQQAAFYAFNWEVLSVLCVLPFEGDGWILFPNLLVWILFGLAVYLLALEAGAARGHALSSAGMALTLPIVLENIHTLHVDLAMAAFFLAGLYLIVFFLRTRSFLVLALLLSAVAMTAGIKLSGAVYGMVLLALLLAGQVRHWVKEKKLVDLHGSPGGITVILGLAGMAAALLVGAFWYAVILYRSQLHFKDPFFLLNPTGEALEQLRMTSLARVFDPGLGEHWRILRGQVMEQLFAPFLVMTLLGGIGLAALFVQRDKIRASRVWILAGLIALCAYLYWHAPYSGATASAPMELRPWFGQAIRYAFPLLGLMGAACAVGAAWLRIPGAWMVGAALACMFLSLARAGTLHNEAVLHYIPFLLAAGSLVYFLHFRIPGGRRGVLTLIRITLVVVLVVLACGSHWRKAHDLHRRDRYGPIADHVTDEIDNQETVGYLLSHQGYFLHGRDLMQRLDFLPSRGDDPAPWIAMLRRKGIRYVAVGPVLEGWHKELKWHQARELPWLQDPEGPFTPVFGNDPHKETVIYRLK